MTLFDELFVMLMPSANVLRMRRFLKVLLDEPTPQYMTTKCSIQMLSRVTFCMPFPSMNFPGPSTRLRKLPQAEKFLRTDPFACELMLKPTSTFVWSCGAMSFVYQGPAPMI